MPLTRWFWRYILAFGRAHTSVARLILWFGCNSFSGDLELMLAGAAACLALPFAPPANTHSGRPADLRSAPPDSLPAGPVPPLRPPAFGAPPGMQRCSVF